MFGVVVGAVYVISYYKLAKVISDNKYIVPLYFGCFLIMNFMEPFVTSLLFNTIIFYGWKHSSNESYFEKKKDQAMIGVK
jgi:hypothetical protein